MKCPGAAPAGERLTALLGALLCLAIAGCGSPDEDVRGDRGTIDVARALGGDVDSGFARAATPRTFHFPEDHNAHGDFRNEWWYVTGHLRGEGGERFAYQLTFFRIALAPEKPALDSAWASRQLWMAHTAITDLQSGRHYHAQRFARDALGLAGQRADGFALWLDDWRLDGDPGGGFPWYLQVATADFSLDLALQPLREPLLQGEAGLSQKGSQRGNASYYYSITRLETAGRLRRGGQDVLVDGLSWLDREWSSSALEEGQAGWDWFSLQLDSGDDLMLYRMRRDDGSADPNSAGTLLRADGSVMRLGAGDFTLEPLRYWRSPGGARYPVAWALRVPGAELDLRVEALLDAQWMDTAVSYWEGAVGAVDERSGADVGRGFLEMTGY